MRRTAPIALLCLALSGPAFGQAATPDQVDRFARFINSARYTTLVVDRALVTDRAMAPPCADQRQFVGRRLLAVTETPKFVAGRDVPVAGNWLERVTLRRCGATVDHNVFVKATPDRGVQASTGFPGESRTALELQIEVGRAVIEKAKADMPACNRREIVAMAVAERAAPRGQPWSERWTVWSCGRLLTYAIRFAPKPDGSAGFAIGG
jgi:hypothetical protein